MLILRPPMTLPEHSTATATSEASTKVTKAEPSSWRPSWDRFRRHRTFSTAPNFVICCLIAASMAAFSGVTRHPLT